jgi:hypothetical protein
MELKETAIEDHRTLMILLIFDGMMVDFEFWQHRFSTFLGFLSSIIDMQKIVQQKGNTQANGSQLCLAQQ